MKSFFSNVLASIIGCFIVLGLFFLISIISLVGMMASSDQKYNLKNNTVLTIKLEGSLSDRAENNPLAKFLNPSAVEEIGLDEVLASIDKAKENENIKGIYIYAGAFSASGASIKEIRDRLIDFKETGKFIVAYGDVYMQGCYYLASVADKIILNPQGNLDLHGLAASPTFYKGLMEKLGIEMQIFKVGTFKSAVEPFMLDKMSDANREQLTSYMTDSWNTLLSEVSQSRNISVEQLNLITDSLPLFDQAQKNVQKGLIDTLMYETDVKKYIQTLVGVKEEKDMRMASIKNMKTVPSLNDSKSDDIVAVLYAEGGINSGKSGDGIRDGKLIKEIEKLIKDDNVKAVVLRVNSPGGSAYASEQIWKSINDLKEKKPVVVSMGGVAASGGYYISCNASKIIAEPNTITGSIGIFGMFPNIEGLTKKVGLSYDVVKTNNFSDFGDINRPMRADEKVLLQNYIERGYDLFLTRCSEGRGIPKDSLDMIAQGRVWTGKQALEIGLVDALGGMDFAIKEVAKLADISDYSVVDYPKETDFFQAFLEAKKEEMAISAVKEYLGSDFEMFMKLKEIKEQDYIQARLPYDFEIK